MIQIKNEKNRIRAELLELRSRLDPDEKAAAEAKIFASFRELATYRFCDTLLLYSPIKGEPDVNIAAKTALADGKRIAYPITEPVGHVMKFGYVNSPDELLRGNFGIPEPPHDAELFDEGINTHAICVVPALAFDADGYRLGYGKGYYDRFLAKFTGVKAGLVMSRFILPKLPRGRYDLAVDVIITEDGVKAFGKGKS
jgi:5,10-methenyltetrahydrofolate synthetase